MEGRAIVRPNRSITAARSQPASCFNGGPGNCPAEPCSHLRAILAANPLQWRAGQLSGRTPCHGFGEFACSCASMEGRAIVRPNVLLFRLLYGAALASMEGRAIVRPNDVEPGVLPQVVQASMEGRAIVRPNRPDLGGAPDPGHRFNGGPGNCPAELVVGQVERLHEGEASMEGRAIVRPNQNDVPGIAAPQMLQWRAGQLSGRTTDDDGLSAMRKSRLQWRAGQLSGRTSMAGDLALSGTLLQWRAGQLSGRTCYTTPLPLPRLWLQWRAGQLSGRTR